MLECTVCGQKKKRNQSDKLEITIETDRDDR